MHLPLKSGITFGLTAGLGVLLAASASSPSEKGQRAPSGFLAQRTNPISFPKDEQLLKAFSTHRQAFDRLRQMVAEDAKQQGPIFSEDSLRDDLPASRRQEYRTLLESIQPGLVVTFDYDGIVRFIFAATGTSAIGAGSLKGIEFVPAGAQPGAIMLKSLDDVEKLGEGVYLRPIEQGWYLLFQETL